MPLDHFVTLGRSGLRVSPLCLGAMTFGTEWGFGSDAETSKQVIDAYLGRGGNFIDTANIYTRGHAEKIMGDHLCRDRARRDRVVIATKFGGNLYAGDPNGGGAGRKGVVAACEQSLRRLQTDYIDLYWMHFWDRLTPIEETMDALNDLVRQGKVRYIGFSDTPAWKCAQAQMLARQHSLSPVIALQLEYSLMERTLEGEFGPFMAEFGLALCPWSPLKGGILTGKYTRDTHPGGYDDPGGDKGGRYQQDSRYLTDTTYAIVDALVAIGTETGATPAQVALRWVTLQPGVTSTIIGARTLKQLEANMDALDITLPPEAVARLNELSEPELSNPHGFLKTIAVGIHGGISINGDEPESWPLCPANDSERY
ncbi:MAG: aldo/keto reductase [Planctomycetes bacterium]|nr:aldo/keto reductase [Planctomycetota bacterium]